MIRADPSRRELPAALVAGGRVRQVRGRGAIQGWLQPSGVGSVTQLSCIYAILTLAPTVAACASVPACSGKFLQAQAARAASLKSGNSAVRVPRILPQPPGT